MLRVLISAVVFASAATAASAQSVAVVGPEGQSMTLSAADIASLPRHVVTLSAHGESHVYEGPLLIDILAKVGAPTGKALRGEALADVVLVEASDGYVVALGLAETDPGTRPNPIILADKADGAPLTAQDGPFRLVIEGDLRPARSTRMVSKVTVRRLGENRPAARPHAH